MPFIQSITPTTGSVYGGSVVTLIGNGFSSTTSTVFLDTAKCVVTQATLGQLKCLTSAHAAGTANLAIR